MAESPLARCLKCGSPLPPAGECPACAARANTGASAQPAVLDKDLNLDRRKERPAAPQIPSFDQLTTRQPPRAAPPPPPATGYKPSPIPPGMSPKRTQSSPQAPAADPSAAVTQAVAPLQPRRPAVDPATQVTQPAEKITEAALPPPKPPPAAPASPAAQKPAAAAPARTPSGPSVPVAPAPLPRRTTQDDLIAQHLAPSATAGPVRTAAARQREVRAAPAPLWRRLLAFLIDAALILGVASLFLVVATTVAGIKAPETQFKGFDRLITYAVAFQSVLKPTAALAVILALLYATAFAFIWDGRTVGRRLLGIQLVDGTGFPPSLGRAAARAALSLLSFAVFLGGFWLALFDRRGQTLHDKLTGTFVIHRK